MEHGSGVLGILMARTVSLHYYNIWVPTLYSIKENSVQREKKGLWEIYQKDHVVSPLSNVLVGEEGGKSAFLQDDAYHLFIHIVCGIVPASPVSHKSTQ